MRMPSCAPRPVPTNSAVGVASPSAQGQAMMSTETAAVNAVFAGAPASSQPAHVTTASPMTIGTNTAETRSASRCTAALPLCASATSRAIWANWVSAPTRVARTNSTPPALTVAPATSSPGPTSTGTASPVSIAASTAEAARRDDAVGGHLLAGAHHEHVANREFADGNAGFDVVAHHGHVLGAHVEQRPQRGAGLRLGARLEVTAGQYERGDDGRDFEVEVMRRACEQFPPRPRVCGEHADRDQGVHGGGAVTQVRGRRAVERPCAPQHHRRGQRERQPRPACELQRGRHRQRQYGQAQHRGYHQAEQVRLLDRVVDGCERRAVAGGLDGGHQLSGRDGRRRLDGGLFRREVHGGMHAGDAVEPLLDAPGA